MSSGNHMYNFDRDRDTRSPVRYAWKTYYAKRDAQKAALEKLGLPLPKEDDDDEPYEPYAAGGW